MNRYGYNKENRKGRRLLRRSRLFLGIFLLYLVFIIVFVSGYCALALIDYRTNRQSELEEQYETMVSLLGTVADNDLLQAKFITSSVNNSTSVKNVYTQSALFNTSVDSYLYSQMKSELTTILAQRDDLAITQLMVIFNNSYRVYTSSSVISLKDAWQNYNYPSGSGLALSSVSDLLRIENQNILMKSEYLVYYADYCYSYNGVSRGIVLVLLSPDVIVKQINEKLGDYAGFSILSGEDVLLESGTLEGRIFTCSSTVEDGISYNLYIPSEAFSFGLNGMIMATLAFGLFCGLVAVGLAWYISFRNYLHYEHIMQIMKPGEDTVATDEEMIVSAMRQLIDEKDEISEKMLEIQPYAQKGILQEALQGNLDPKNLSILSQEQQELKFLYFAVTVVNLVIQPVEEDREIPEHLMKRAEEAVKQMSGSQCQFYSFTKDNHYLYAIVSFDDIPEWEELFYRMKDRIEYSVCEKDILITAGVSGLKEDTAQLKDACREAEEALTYMITGGRSQVYFYDPHLLTDEKEYYFPKNAVKTLTLLLQNKDTDGITRFFDDLLETNTKQYEVSARSMELLVEELHAVTIFVIREICEPGETLIAVRKPTEAATIEEILNYYQGIYKTLVLRLPDLVNTDESLDNRRSLILEYINSHYLDKDLSLQMLSEKFNVTNKFISGLCNATYGKNYLQYVQEKRISYAKELLISGEYSIDEVADLSGYSSTLTFRRNFRAIVGMNPSNFAENSAKRES